MPENFPMNAIVELDLMDDSNIKDIKKELQNKLEIPPEFVNLAPLDLKNYLGDNERIIKEG